MDATPEASPQTHAEQPSARRAPARPPVPWWHVGAVADIRRSSRLTAEYVLLTVLAAAIATLGLITDSAAVIIGAMLIAPLLGPIMGIALGALGGRAHLLLRAAATLAAGVALSLGVSYALAWLALQLPFDALATLPNEVSSRTHPGPFDLAIALAGGAAAAYALVRMKGAAALFGVAIATALVPPLCTIGIGLALGDPGISSAAAVLFATNAVAIAASATIVFTTLRLRPRRSRAGHSGLALAAGLVVALGLVLVPSAISVAQRSRAAASQAQFADTVSQTVVDVLSARLPGSRVTDVERTQEGAVLDLRVTAELVSPPSAGVVADIQADVATRLRRTVHVVIVGLPVVEIDAVATAAPSALPEPTAPSETASPTPQATPTPTPLPTMRPPGHIDASAWFASVTPRAVAAADAKHLVLVGATGDGIAGMAATSDDGGLRWQVTRLAAFPLAGAAAAGSALWATVPCPAGAAPGCRPGLATSADGGASWTMAVVPSAARAALLDDLTGWAVSAAAADGGATLFETSDGGLTWTQGPVACPAAAPVVAALSVTSPTDGWLACAGDGSDPAAKALLATTDGGATWTTVASAATGGKVEPSGQPRLPADGSLAGISMQGGGVGWLWTQGALYRTADGGRRWAPITPQSEGASVGIVSASVVDAKAGFVLVASPAAGPVELLRTGDGGGSWTALGSWPAGSPAPPSAGPSSGPATTPAATGAASATSSPAP